MSDQEQAQVSQEPDANYSDDQELDQDPEVEQEQEESENNASPGHHADLEYSPDQKPRVLETDDDFKTPSQQLRMDNQQSLETQSPFSMADKSASKKSTYSHKRHSKNFIESNKTVKTRDELFSAFSERKKSRISQVQESKRNSLFNQYYTASFEKKSSKSRQEEWSSIMLKNSQLSTEKPVYSGQKNQSKDFVVKHVEVPIDKLKASKNSALGGTFSKNRREKWYHQTNSSSINRLRSYQSLDVEVGQEDREFPTTKGNQGLKRAMNHSQVFSRDIPHTDADQVPEGFTSHRGSKCYVHNVNNVQVQNARLKHRSSQVF